MTEEPLPTEEEKPPAEEDYWETAEWGPWPTRKPASEGCSPYQIVSLYGDAWRSELS